MRGCSISRFVHAAHWDARGNAGRVNCALAEMLSSGGAAAAGT